MKDHSSEQILVKDIWWEDGDLHILTTDDKEIIYHNSYISVRKIEPETNKDILIEEINIKKIKNKDI